MKKTPTPEPLEIADFSRPWLTPFEHYMAMSNGVYRFNPGICHYVAQETFAAGAAFPVHHHEFLEILLVTRGGLQHTRGHRKAVLGADTVVLVAASQPHAYQATEDGTTVLVLSFLPSLLGFNDQLMAESRLNDLGTLLSSFQETPDESTRRLSPADMAKVSFLARVALERQNYLKQDPQQLGRAAFKLAIQMLLEIITQPTPKGAKPFVLDIVAWLQENYRERISQSKLAARFGLSPSFLSTQFNRLTGTSLPQYVNRLRMEEAKQLLATTDWPVSRIAVETGYDSITHFNDTFKEHGGLTPTQWRKQATAYMKRAR